MAILRTGLAERYIGLRTLPLDMSSTSGFATDIYTYIYIYIYIYTHTQYIYIYTIYIYIYIYIYFVCVRACVLYKTENTRWWWWRWQRWRSLNSVHSFIISVLPQQPFGRLQVQHRNITECTANNNSQIKTRRKIIRRKNQVKTLWIIVKF